MLCSCVILLDKYVYFLPINNRYISRIFSFTDRISHAELKCAPNYVLRYLPISSIFFRCTISFTLNLLTGGSRNITILIWRKISGKSFIRNTVSDIDDFFHDFTIWSVDILTYTHVTRLYAFTYTAGKH